jgi:hypothetical protein
VIGQDLIGITGDAQPTCREIVPHEPKKRHASQFVPAGDVGTRPAGKLIVSLRLGDGLRIQIFVPLVSWRSVGCDNEYWPAVLVNFGPPPGFDLLSRAEVRRKR